MFGNMHSGPECLFLSWVRKFVIYPAIKDVLRSFLSSSGVLTMWMLACLMYQKSLQTYSFLFIVFFFFSVQHRWFPLLSSNFLIHSSESCNLLFIPFSVFLFQLLYSSALFYFSLYVLTLDYNFSLYHAILSYVLSTFLPSLPWTLNG